MSFVSHTPLPRFGNDPSAFDFNSLGALKQGVRADGAAAGQSHREVARQFEAMFVQLLLKQARQVSAHRPDLLDSSAVRMVQGMQDEQRALSLADPGLGLADALMAQMRTDASTPGARADLSHSAPEQAPSRLPGLQSRMRLERGEVADSISSLIQLLTTGRAGETIRGAVQGAPQHIRTFVDRMAGAAQVAAQRSGVPARLILSQAALESAWGRREIRHADGTSAHNLFGIKAGRHWHGDVAQVWTTEYKDGAPHKLQQTFRAYDSYEAAFADYANLVGNSPRYQAVVGAASAEEAARHIQEAGYATDPSYADKLISIMGYFRAQ